MDELVELVVDVLRIADEFLMDRLKEICESVLGEQVRAKTAVSFLEISLMYAAKSLTTTCIDFLCHNIEMVLDQRWLEGVEDEVVQLVEEALRKKQEKLQPYTRSGGHLPDPAVVQEMREMIQDEGYHYFRPLGTFQSDPPKTQQRPDSHRTLDQGNPSAPRPLSISLTTSETVTTPPAELPPRLSATPIPSLVVSSLPNRQSALDAAGGLRPLSRAMSSDISSQGSRASPSTKDWPTLSDAPSAELKEIRSMPVRKTSWGQVPTVDPAVHLDDQDISTATSSTHKPTLRDILEQEQEQRNGQASSQTPATAGTPMHKTSKLSQKERRKQLQQQLVSTIQDHDTSASPAQHPHAWAKVGPATTLDLCTVGNEGTVGQVKRSGTMPKSNTPLSSPSLLELQQSELALFRTQPKEVPRVAIATSKPVKETMRASGGGERTFSEAPWRLDAIPEPLRAVTRHQSQMYPRLETSSTNHGQGQGGGSGGSGGGSGSNKAGPGFREHQGSPGTCKSQPLQSGGGSTALSPSMVDVSSSLSGSSGVSPSPSSTMALSSFAIIQNQQLRDRNLLLRARHQKKSLYQIQIEEQALNQLRLLSLERIQTKATEGTGEWFTVGH
ncbi:hypothetical protein BGX23_009351 [Mortierella sp. AD031]|nr:hypothetical protein BGX23_009351 [Mortierella sp. AD031]